MLTWAAVLAGVIFDRCCINREDVVSTIQLRILWTASFLAASAALLPDAAGAQDGNVVQVPEGTTASLMSTLADLADRRMKGDAAAVIVELPAGVYELSEPIRLDAKRVGKGLTLRAKKGEEVVLSGAVPLQPAAESEQGFRRYTLPAGMTWKGVPRQLMVNGRLRGAARFPDEGYLRIEKSLPDRRSGFVVSEGALPEALDLSRGHCDLIFLHDWSSSRLPVAEWNRETRELKTVGPIGCEAPHYAIDHFEKQPRFALEGQAAFANLAGEWYFDAQSQSILLRVAEGEPVPQVQLPWLQQLLVATGDEGAPLKNLTLQGLIFTGAAFEMPAGGLAGAQATMHEPRDETGKRTTSHRPLLPAAVHLEWAESCRVLACQFRELGGSGLWIAGGTRGCVVQRCRFEHLGGNGINLGEDSSRRVGGKAWYAAAPDQIPTGHRVDDCTLQHCGEVLPGAVAVWAALNRELEVTNNVIRDCPYTGISLGWIWDDSVTPAGKNRITGNTIEFVMQVLSDGGGIYTLGRQPESVIEGNSIADVPLNAGRAESNGMFLDQGSTGFTIRDNTIRRVDRSPLRFHQAGENLVEGNRWELATPQTPPVRFNNTPEKNITIRGNEVLAPQQRIFLIGNSLTWDTVPSRLEENVHWHVDCGKSLPYIQAHPQAPCVSSSRLWPTAFSSARYDVLVFQPHYGSTLEADVEVLSAWMQQQPEARVIIHTGWARSATLAEERAAQEAGGAMVHSQAWFDALHNSLQERFPNREIGSTRAMQLLWQVADDIAAGRGPLKNIETLYRDAIHMTPDGGRYLMHHALRKAVGQPPLGEEYAGVNEDLRPYLDEVLRRVLDD